MRWVFDGDLAAAAHIWAAAAGVSRSIAPHHIADALLERRDLFAASVEGTRRALEEAGLDRPPYAGCEIVVLRGEAYLLWRTGGHDVKLFPPTDRVDVWPWEKLRPNTLPPPKAWRVQVECFHDCGRRCVSTRVAEAARQLWEAHGDALRAASLAARHGLMHANAKEPGDPDYERMIAALEAAIS